MDNINGVSFEDWAAACGNMAAGMGEAEVAQILGIDEPTWVDTNQQWASQLGVLMTENMALASKYAEIFANPLVGKFATAGSVKPLTLDEVLAIAPDYNSYKKIFWHQSKAAEAGEEPEAIIASYGLNLQAWAQLNTHYTHWFASYVDATLITTEPETYQKRYDEITAIDQHWQDFYSSEYGV